MKAAPGLPAIAPASAPATVLVVSCEHGGRRVPRPCAALFEGHEALLAGHRGWDAGALALARRLARAAGVPVHAATVTRLLVDLNRSIGHPQLFSAVTRTLPPADRQALVDRYHRPHRAHVAAVVARHIAAGRRVVHVASHSFTPVLDGVERTVDVGWLYDPRRSGETGFAGAWMAQAAQRLPGLRLRRNAPYRGRSDGLTAWLRTRHPDAAYAGIELELNQRFVRQGGAPWRRVQAALTESLLAAWPDALPAAGR